MQRPEVFPEEAKVVLVGNEAVAVEVDLAEELLVDFLGPLDVDGVEGVLHGLDEFGEVHDALAAVGVDLLAVQALDRHFAEVLFDAEIDLDMK